ncbi:MAG: FlgD immunoglobulin-like domain containing protein, partial [Spirochaetia bacterium]
MRVGATAPGAFLIRILNTAGETVYSVGPVPANDFVTELMWDGTDDTGEAVPDGRYLLAAYELAEDKTLADFSQRANASAAPDLSTRVEVNREFRVR